MDRGGKHVISCGEQRTPTPELVSLTGSRPRATMTAVLLRAHEPASFFLKLLQKIEKMQNCPDLFMRQ